MRSTALIALLALLPALPGPSPAQEDNKKEEKKQEKTPQQQQAERRVEWIMRTLSRQLELSESQKGKIKEILLATETRQSKLREEQAGEIEKLLTPDQQEKYKALRNRQNQGGPGQRGGRDGRGGRMGRMMGLDIERIKERLGLTPEQEKKIQGIIQDAMQKGQEQMQKMREGGGFDFNKMRELMENGRKEIRGKIALLLNDEQKKKFDELNKEMDERMQRFMGRFGQGGRGGRGGARQARGPRTPEQITERRLKEAMDSLKLPKEEAAVLGELIKKVIAYQSTSGQQARQMREEIRKLATGGGDAEAIKAKVTELRKQRDARDAMLKTLRDGLKELLTPQQEAVLVSHGVLD